MIGHVYVCGTEVIARAQSTCIPDQAYPRTTARRRLALLGHHDERRAKTVAHLLMEGGIGAENGLGQTRVDRGVAGMPDGRSGMMQRRLSRAVWRRSVVV